jgi:hypothetical protein
MFQVNATECTDLQGIDDIIERATSKEHIRGIDVEKVTSTLQIREVYNRSSYILWILCIVIILIGLGILWFVWANTNKPYFCSWKLIHPPTSVDDEFNEFNEHGSQREMVELHVIAAETQGGATGTEHGKAEEKAIEKPSPPTVFARRLLLAADDP